MRVNVCAQMRESKRKRAEGWCAWGESREVEEEEEEVEEEEEEEEEEKEVELPRHGRDWGKEESCVGCELGARVHETEKDGEQEGKREGATALVGDERNIRDGRRRPRSRERERDDK